MQSIDELAISQYMTLADKVGKLQRRIKYLRWAFYQQTFHSRIVYTGYEIVSQAIKVDKAIERLDETIGTIEQHIKLIETKQRYWEDFLNSLSVQDRQYFINKYLKGYVVMNERLDSLALEEIDEINSAIVFQFCSLFEEEEDREHLELSTEDVQTSIDSILAFLEV